ncbi:glycosyltransferase family 2 protein [Paenibacillus sp. 1_12]|uniref:glycosyltransferase family 2 protein n=1 Tax=Paenibacillus sp. 1_12 TaxID=1566278 RepID=UPI000B87354B|nr:glycosyltransferase family 2 protein [Paenibacillus sp. 1_12]
MKKYKTHLSVVIPVYGCAECLFELYERLVNVLDKITPCYEIILVNDASPDNSWVYIEQLVSKDSKVVGINLSRNFGQHYAITAGLDHTDSEWVVVMDCDLQDQPEQIQMMYDKTNEGFDIVLGRRYARQDSFLKKIGSNLFYKLFSYMTETNQDGTIANFGIYNGKVIDTITKMRENLRFFPTMIKWVGYKVTTINIEHANREYGKSGYSLKKLVNLAFDVIISFSDKPLRLTVKTGFFISFFSFFYALYIIIRAVLGIKSLEGWSSLIVSIWFLSGLIIFILGIVGIYINKIFDEVKKRPIYIVQDLSINKEL